MPKGKRGPRPQMKNKNNDQPEKRVALRYACTSEGCEFVGTFAEWEYHKEGELAHAEYQMKQVTLDDDDPTAEEIVGKENVVDVGSADDEEHSAVIDRDFKDKVEEAIAAKHAERQGYKCSNPSCTYQTTYLSEMEEHVNGTGHGSYVTDVIEPVQEQLPLPGIVRRYIEIPMPEDMLNEKRARLAELYQKQLEVRDEKKAADDEFNARLKTIDNDMQAIARVLREPVTFELADCEWRIIEGENARGLYRLDNGDMIEKEALSAEDREDELQQAEQDNQQEEVTA